MAGIATIWKRAWDKILIVKSSYMDLNTKEMLMPEFIQDIPK